MNTTELLTIFYNGHFTQMVYPHQVQKQLEDWGLPREDIDIVQYENSKVVAPFNVGDDKELFILTEETQTGDTPTPLMDLRAVFKEVIRSEEGRPFFELFKKNNRKLREHRLNEISIEFSEEDLTPPSFYKVDAIVPPLNLMIKGKLIKQNSIDLSGLEEK